MWSINHSGNIGKVAHPTCAVSKGLPKWYQFVLNVLVRLFELHFSVTGETKLINSQQPQKQRNDRISAVMRLQVFKSQQSSKTPRAPVDHLSEHQSRKIAHEASSSHCPRCDFSLQLSSDSKVYFYWEYYLSITSEPVTLSHTSSSWSNSSWCVSMSLDQQLYAAESLWSWCCQAVKPLMPGRIF